MIVTDAWRRGVIVTLIGTVEVAIVIVPSSRSNYKDTIQSIQRCWAVLVVVDYGEEAGEGPFQ